MKEYSRIKFILSYLEVKKHHYGWDMMDFMTMSERI